MNRQIKFLTFLKKKGGDIKPIDITKELSNLGLKDVNQVYDFMNTLSAKGYIEWVDRRRRIQSNIEGVFVPGGFPDKNAPLSFEAKILGDGLEYIDERSIKTNNNMGLYISVTANVLLGVISILLTYFNNEKERELEKLKEETENKHRKSEYVIRNLKSQIEKEKTKIRLNIPLDSKEDRVKNISHNEHRQ